MSWRIKTVLIAFAVLIVACFVGLSTAAKSGSPAGSVVKVQLVGGHGSATHIGNGAFITAAHVVKNAKTVTLRADDGSEREAEVEWINEQFDIALLRASSGFDTITPAYLSCRVPEPAELVTARGNPLMMENITTYGYVSGFVGTQGPWRSVVPLNIAIGGGMSGGAIFDEWGYLVGVIVGAPLQPIGMGGSMIGIGFAVDARSVCRLLARDA